jgi:hypothetical protein
MLTKLQEGQWTDIIKVRLRTKVHICWTPPPPKGWTPNSAYRTFDYMHYGNYPMRIRIIKLEILVQKEKRRNVWAPSPHTNSYTIHLPFINYGSNPVIKKAGSPDPTRSSPSNTKIIGSQRTSNSVRFSWKPVLGIRIRWIRNKVTSWIQILTIYYKFTGTDLKKFQKKFNIFEYSTIYYGYSKLTTY